MYFDYKDIATEKQVSYILLMTGDDGIHMFNIWGLEGDDAQNPDKVWEEFDAPGGTQVDFPCGKADFPTYAPEGGRN